jgi:hypothetical protein
MLAQTLRKPLSIGAESLRPDRLAGPQPNFAGDKMVNLIGHNDKQLGKSRPVGIKMLPCNAMSEVQEVREVRKVR